MGGMSGKHSAKLKTPRRQHRRRWNQGQSGRFYQTSAESLEVAFTLRFVFEKKIKKSNFIIGSAEALPILCVRYARWEREIQREREREREIDGSDVIIVALKLAMTSHFPLPKIRTFRSSLHTSCRRSFVKWSPLWRWNSQWVHTFRCQKKSPSLFGLSLEWREPRDEWSKTQDKLMIKFCPVLLFFPLKKWIKLIPKTIGNRKRDCAWGYSGW